MEFIQVAKLAEETGFSHIGLLDPAALCLRQEVRQMCAACHQYGKRWSCPPGCGELEQLKQKITGFSRGILLQTTAELEDEFDGEGMMEAEQLHKERFFQMTERLRALPGNYFPLGAGCCALCKTCTYPHDPCRFPERMIFSMEACGLVVADVCRDNGMPYHYGENTITYTSCILF